MTVVAVHQPNFLPYPGFFRKMSLADIFVLYDTAQFVRREYHNRNRIKTPHGVKWLTVPVKASSTQPINEVVIDEGTDWRSRLWRTIQTSYGRAPYFSRYAASLRETLFSSESERLVDLNTRLIRLLHDHLSLQTEICLASQLPPLRAINPTDKLIELTRAMGGDSYLSGVGALAYMEMDKFTDINLRLVRSPPVAYPQGWGPFAPNLSIIDAVFNCGPSTSELILEDLLVGGRALA